MHTRKRLDVRTRLLIGLAIIGCLALPACSISVKKDSDGQDKNVDINTPLGGIHVDNGADVRDTGLPVYPGSRVRQETPGEKNNANVNISGMGYGLRVVAVQYESDDSPTKVISYYKDQLKKYGAVLECHTTKSPDVSMTHRDDSKKWDLTCGPDTGNNVELKVGSEENQHIVSVKPEGKGSQFALVHVQVRGKDTTI